MIERDAPAPPFRQLAEILRARIERGDWEPGRAIPSESRLCQEYDLARMTVRRALAELAADGVIFTVTGRGSYVAETDD